MASLLIAIIYLAFVSMGLPDSLLGSAWPSIYPKLQVPVSFAGILTILIASGTVISSLLSNRLIKRFGTSRVTVACTALTALALFGFSISNAFWQLCLWALPYGLGAGSIDAALNNYVALNYKSRHMNWIHFFWGVGATAGPYIMGNLLTGGAAWNAGYRVVGIIQVGMTLALLLSLPLWKKSAVDANDKSGKGGATTASAIRLPGAKSVLTAFFCYCALEATAGLWSSSYMVLFRGVDAATAATWVSVYYLGITIGRFLSGLISDKVGDKGMVRIGQCVLLLGAALLLLPLGTGACLISLILIGLGCAPVYPCLLHETPKNFGAENSQAMMGVQMACAYTGSTLMPPLFGLVAQYINIGLLPVCLLAIAALMLIMSETMNAKKRAAN